MAKNKLLLILSILLTFTVHENIRAEISSDTCQKAVEKDNSPENEPENNTSDSDGRYISDKTVSVRGGDYDKSGFHEFLMGKNYRKTWNTKVEVPVLDFSRVEGGLIPYDKGGGNQSSNLEMRNINDREFVARSVNKDPGKGAVPAPFKNTFVENMIQDLVSAQYPYASLVTQDLSRAAGILHPERTLYWIPDDTALNGELKDLSETLVLFEEDPEKDHSNAENLGCPENIIETESLLDNLQEDHNNTVLQEELAKARLFDMLVGDWDRHSDQFKWAEFEQEDGGYSYRVIPEDRDQAFFSLDGGLPFLMSRVAGLNQLQKFKEDIPNGKGLNKVAEDFDNRFINELTREEWVALADDLQHQLSDRVIENALTSLPDEVEKINSDAIYQKLKSRRNQLPQVASDYYERLSRKVSITGSDKEEYFKVDRMDDSTRVIVYRGTDPNNNSSPFYSRTFYHDETREISLYGLDGSDNFEVSGSGNNGLKVRIYGGPGQDNIKDDSQVSSLTRKTIVYDTDRETRIKGGEETKTRIKEKYAGNEAFNNGPQVSRQ